MEQKAVLVKNPRKFLSKLHQFLIYCRRFLTKKTFEKVLITSTLITLAACTNQKKLNETAINEANAAYSREEAQASGLGEPAYFGDERAGSYQKKGTNRIYYFDFDKYFVHEIDKPAILANANYLLAHPKAKVLLEGHTDPRGSREYNIGLGERRAKAVANILITRGVNPVQIRVVSYGAEKLAAVGHTEADYQLDRRVVLVYLQR